MRNKVFCDWGKEVRVDDVVVVAPQMKAAVFLSQRSSRVAEPGDTQSGKDQWRIVGTAFLYGIMETGDLMLDVVGTLA